MLNYFCEMWKTKKYGRISQMDINSSYQVINNIIVNRNENYVIVNFNVAQKVTAEELNVAPPIFNSLTV